MKRNNSFKFLVYLVLLFAFCVVSFNENIGTQKIGNDRVELYAGNIEDNNPGQGFSINDMNGVWAQTQTINIFNSNYLFPGDSGTYQFLVSNNTDEEAEYDLDLSYQTNSDPHLGFKLKKNGVYIHGDEADEYGENYISWLPTYSTMTLAAHESDLYTLEWKWADSGPSTEGDPINAADYLITATFNVTATEIYYYVPPVEDPSSTEPIDSTSGTNVATGDNISYYVILAGLSGVILVLLSIRKKQKVKNESTQNN